MQPVSISISGKTVPLYKGSFALIIGESDYWYMKKLPGVVNDVIEVKKALENQGFSVTIALDQAKPQLEKSISDFIARYGQEVDNRLIIYFAGHGYNLTTNFGEELAYILPVEAPVPTPQNQSEFQETCLEMAQLDTYIKRIQSKHALFLFDACFSGSLFENMRSTPDYINNNTLKPVRQFITSGMSDEMVPDHSIFCVQFVQALLGEGDTDHDGYLTGTELGAYLYKTVTNYSKNTQHPQYGKIRNPIFDKGDFVFVLKNILDTTNPDFNDDTRISKSETKPSENGTIKKTSETPFQRVYVDSSQYYAKKGETDAIQYYKGKNSGAIWSGCATALGFYAGFIVGGICSASPPNSLNLQMPNPYLSTNYFYNKTYTEKAHKIKKKKIWTGVGIGAGIFVIWAVPLIVLAATDNL